MSDDESFVILGSSPTSSLQIDEPLSVNYPSLKDNKQTERSEPTDLNKLKSTTSEEPREESSTDNNIKSSNHEKSNALHSNGSVETTNHTSLAADFLLGEVQADVLKNSVYSQFPSVSMQACAEDVIKLQSLMSEYIELKLTLSKVNNTMKLYYESSKQWRDDALKENQQNQQNMQDIQTQIEKLRDENCFLKREIQTNEEQLKISEEERQKENDELRQCVSEKVSLINNMRVQIEKLERQQLKSFDFVLENDEKDEQPQKQNFITRTEHEASIKDFERKMSVLLAENLEFKDMQKTYIDEIDCLKVNLTCNEELLAKTRASVKGMKRKDLEYDEDIANLRHQMEIYRSEYLMERLDREKNVAEKEQLVEDLRKLQRRNQELIEALAEADRTKMELMNLPKKTVKMDRHRPVRELVDPFAAITRGSLFVTPNSISDEAGCPICSKRFKSLNVLQGHVNNCLDKN